MILELSEIHTFYSESHILFGISLTVARGEIVCLVGRNGAGKTTTLRSIIGLTPPRSGTIRLKGEDITGRPPFWIARRGVGYVPEDRRIFSDLTVLENLEVGVKNHNGRSTKWTVDRIFGFFPALRGLQKRIGGLLSGGEQQMLTIARTLMGNPEILLLDEPSEGLSPLVSKFLAKQVKDLKTGGLSILLCEQNLRFSMLVSDRAFIVEKGQIRFKGSIRELQENEVVRKTYLGV